MSDQQSPRPRIPSWREINLARETLSPEAFARWQIERGLLICCGPRPRARAADREAEAG